MAREIQRSLVSQPMSTTPYDEWKCPQPRDVHGQRIQVTAYYDESGHVVERWQFSETDVRWYRLEAFKERWVAIKVQARTAVGNT